MRSSVQCNGRINPELRDEFKEFCHKNGISQDNAMEAAIRLLVMGKEDNSFPNARSEVETIQKCLGIITENCMQLAQRLENEKLLNSETHKNAVSDLEEKIKQQDATITQQTEALKVAEDKIKELTKRVDSEIERASLFQREKDIAIMEKANLQESYAIQQEKNAEIKNQAKKIRKLEDEKAELKSSLQQAYNIIQVLSLSKEETARLDNKK